MKVFFGATKGAIFDPATGTAVQLTKFASERTNYKKAPLTVKTSTLIENGSRYNLSASVFDASIKKQLADWANAGTDVKTVIVGQTGAIVWNEASPIVFENLIRMNARDGASILTFEQEFSGASDDDIHECVNLLYALFGWGTISGELPEGATLTGTAIEGSFSGVEFSAQGNDGVPQDSGVYYRFSLPVENQYLTWAVTFVSATYSPVTATIKIIQRDYAGNILATNSAAIGGTNGERVSVSTVTADNVYYVDCYLFDVTGLPDNQSLTVKEPSLRIATGTAYTDY